MCLYGNYQKQSLTNVTNEDGLEMRENFTSLFLGQAGGFIFILFPDLLSTLSLHEAKTS